MAGGAGRAGGTERASAAWKTGGPAQRPAESIPSADDSEKAAGVRRQQDAVPLTSFQRDTLLDFLRTGKPSALPSFWAHYRPTIESGYSSFVYRCYLYTELFFVVHEFCQENRIPLPESLRQEDLLEKRILLTNSVDDFLTLACQLCEEVMEVRPGGSRHTPSAEQARAYIDRHYMDPELSLSSVANAVSVSPNHLSTLFKSKIGVGFSEYLTEVRIRQAKRLLITSDLRVSEVGERVGYQNMEYFSMLFKKNTGQTPSQYRRSHTL